MPGALWWLLLLPTLFSFLSCMVFPSFSYLYLQCLEQCLAHSKRLINIYWLLTKVHSSSMGKQWASLKLFMSKMELTSFLISLQLCQASFHSPQFTICHPFPHPLIRNQFSSPMDSTYTVVLTTLYLFPLTWPPHWCRSLSLSHLDYCNSCWGIGGAGTSLTPLQPILHPATRIFFFIKCRSNHVPLLHKELQWHWKPFSGMAQWEDPWIWSQRFKS